VDSGEVFGLIATNVGLRHAVKLDLRLIETEQVTAPFTLDREQLHSDGIEFDKAGNPVRYWVMKEHPGELGTVAALFPDGFDPWPARFVLHYYRQDRPGQSRGVPDLTPAIDQFAELRRYSKAVIAAAEAAADHALVVYTDSPPDVDGSTGSEEVEAMDQIELTRGLATTLPAGWKLGQVEAQQPQTQYADFVRSKLAEISRALNVPFYIAALDTAGANMSSTYVVGQKYERTVFVDRSDFDRLMNQLKREWLVEWALMNPVDADEAREMPHVWQWDEVGNHADPVKVANAQTTRLASGVTNIPREYAKQGLDWEEEQEAAAKALGLTVQHYRQLLVQKLFGPPPADPEEADTTEDNDDDDDDDDDTDLE
jgi:capsid protein